MDETMYSMYVLVTLWDRVKSGVITDRTKTITQKRENWIVTNDSTVTRETWHSGIYDTEEDPVENSGKGTVTGPDHPSIHIKVSDWFNNYHLVTHF